MPAGRNTSGALVIYFANFKFITIFKKTALKMNLKRVLFFHSYTAQTRQSSPYLYNRITVDENRHFVTG
jgi:hypothetical protein